MNVLLLTTHLNAGGITSYLQTLAAGLVREGHSVWLGSSGGERAADFERTGVRLVALNIKTKSEISPKIYLALGELRNLIDEHHIDVIHAQTRITQVMAALLNRTTGRPNVATCHGFFKTRWNRRLFPCWGIRTIAISEPVVHHLQNDFRCPADRIALIPNGIDLQRFYVADEELRRATRARYNLQDEPVVGIIARLSDVKGIDILIKAMPQVCKAIPTVKLMIMGEGKEEALLKRLVEEHGLINTVQFIPEVADMAECLNMFDLFVMPSRQEGLGLSVLEAQACGLPVVASRVGGLVSIISNNETGFLVESENIEELATKIIAVLGDDLLRRKIGRQAHDRVRQEHSAHTMVDRTMQLYKELIG